ncbi:hypothetical protein BN2127_JRS1_04089 [Bacillus cereus]|nr:hypothetical protein BN2127_JRS1_04089 [Bacillus cereus]
MTSVFKDMAFQLRTERLDLNMWEESDAVWLRELIGNVEWKCQPLNLFVTILLRSAR